MYLSRERRSPMSYPVRITDQELRAAMRDPRYWQQGQPERKAFVTWVTHGWKALNPEGSSAKTQVWVRAYIREGHSVSSHWRSHSPSQEKVLLTNERGSVPPTYGQRLPSPQDPVGRSGNPIEISPRTNSPATIDGRGYSGHALDRMQGRGLPPIAVEQAIRPENFVGLSRGLRLYWDSTNGVQVLVNPQTNTVVTATWRSIPPRLLRSPE
jgi:hypothetical protein